MDEYKLAAYLGAIEMKIDKLIDLINDTNDLLQDIHDDEITEDQFIEHHDVIKDMLQDIVDHAY